VGATSLASPIGCDEESVGVADGQLDQLDFASDFRQSPGTPLQVAARDTIDDPLLLLAKPVEMSPRDGKLSLSFDERSKPITIRIVRLQVVEFDLGREPRRL
jgi:hypothetical protein